MVVRRTSAAREGATCMDVSPHDRAFLTFWSLAQQLKQLRRQGWLDRGVDEPESAADHSWGVAFLGWLLARDRPELDRERVLLLGLVHDLPEAIAGDPTPFDHLRNRRGAIDPSHFSESPIYSATARDRKTAAERAALTQLLDGVEPALAADIRSAWEEYEASATPEARFVRQIDKLETLLQAETYRRIQPDIVIDSFRRGATRDVTDDYLTRYLSLLHNN